MASNRKVMVLPGDGIGVEVMAANMTVMEWLAKHKSLSFDVAQDHVGGAAYDAYGVPLRDETLADAMAADAGISKAAAKKALESLMGSVSGTLKKGGRVSLVGFGSWSVSKRAARDGRNPQTGATIKIAAKNVVKFKAGAELSSTVN